MLLTLDLPDDVARRLADRAPAAAARDGFVIRAIERALPRYSEDELAAIAAEVEADEALTAEMRAFDVCLTDGLDKHV